MSNQERYDELDNIVSSINILIDDISDRDYIDRLNEIKYEAQNELDEVAEKLQEEQNREERQREKEYWEVAI
ncbi:MAG: hypothetical protein ACI4UX_05805 [Clostridia bacterium]